MPHCQLRLKEVGVILRRDSEEPSIIAAELTEWFAARSIKTVIDKVRPGLDLLIILGGTAHCSMLPPLPAVMTFQ